MLAGLDTAHLALDMAKHAARRQAVIAGNIANADTPGYRARDIASFADTAGRLDGAIPLRQTHPLHLASADATTVHLVAERAGQPESPDGNTVTLETEMAFAIEARRQHNLSLAIYKSALDVMRSALGRGR